MLEHLHLILVRVLSFYGIYSAETNTITLHIGAPTPNISKNIIISMENIILWIEWEIKFNKKFIRNKTLWPNQKYRMKKIGELDSF